MDNGGKLKYDAEMKIEERQVMTNEQAKSK
jgi:hypothetical protein